MMIFGFGYCFNTYHVSWTMETQSSVLSMLERDNEQTSNVPAGSTSTGRKPVVASYTTDYELCNLWS